MVHILSWWYSLLPQHHPPIVLSDAGHMTAGISALSLSPVKQHACTSPTRLHNIYYPYQITQKKYPLDLRFTLLIVIFSHYNFLTINFGNFRDHIAKRRVKQLPLYNGLPLFPLSHLTSPSISHEVTTCRRDPPSVEIAPRLPNCDFMWNGFT